MASHKNMDTTKPVKRLKTEPFSEFAHVTVASNSWVAFMPIDCREPVMCNLQTLEGARPALYIQAVRDEPSGHTTEGLAVHQTSFTKAQLAAFVSSFYVQRLVVTKNVALDEMVGMFTQQGVAFTWNGGLPVNDNATPSGVSVSRITTNASESVREACEDLARGWGYWNRLELCMDASLGSHHRPLPESIDLQHFTGFDCTATRAWIRFCSKSEDAKKTYSEGTCHAIVSYWPDWLDRLILCLASVFVENKLSGYTEATFLQMTGAAQKSPLRSLWWLARDGPCPCRKHGNSNAIQNFADFVRSRLEDSSYAMASPNQPTLSMFQTRHKDNSKRNDEIHFARACLAFCLRTIKEATDYSVLFAGACADEDGSTPERTALAKALQQLGIKVVKWSDDPDRPRRPITFPPYERDLAQKDCPAVLLEFGSR